MSKNEPELGCKPYYIASAERVSELSKAIDRNAKNIDCEYTEIECWAKEIIVHCKLARQFDGL